MQLCTATGETIHATGYGNIQFGHLTVKDVYNKLTLHVSLLSGSKLDRQELYTTFGDYKVIIRKSPIGNIVTTRQLIGRSY